MRSYGTRGVRVRAGAALALAALGITMLSSVGGQAFSGPAEYHGQPDGVTAAATPHVVSAHAYVALSTDSQTDGRRPPRRLHLAQGQSEAAALSADTPDTSRAGSAAVRQQTASALRPVGTIADPAASAIERFASRASRTRGQPVAG